MMIFCQSRIKSKNCSAGLVLLKKATNREQLIDLNQSTSVSVGKDEYTKALGLVWKPKHNVLKFSLREMCKSYPPTKRSTLRLTACQYDPLELICPIVTKAKILIQQISLLKLKWDDPIPDSFQ